MPTISYDSQSLLIDGRRIWLVSTELHYARIPHLRWHRLLTAARQAGFNCITTSIPWNLHEPHPGFFEFDGDLDLRRFVKTVGELGMYCILRPGPYIGSGYDLGGLPAWLLSIPGMQLRQASRPFMELVARFWEQVLEQVKDLQVTAIAQPGLHTSGVGGGGGPIVLMQAEHHWFCHHPSQGEAYLKELVRYLRENGCTVPVTLANNLWQPVEGTIDTWCAGDHLLTDLRQLGAVQPHAPRLVSELFLLRDAPSPPKSTQTNPGQSLRLLLAQALAAGSQYNQTPLCQGIHRGGIGGREPGRGGDVLADPFESSAALLTPAGGLEDLYLAAKHINTFANQFGFVLASMESERHHATMALDSDDHPPSLVHLRGHQGQIVFVFRSSKDRHRELELLLPRGQRLAVPMLQDRVQWIMMEVNLAGVALLDYTNLCPWAFLSRHVLVLYGRAGAKGLISLNGAVRELTVPSASGAKPWIGQHEGLTLVVLARQQLDQAWVTGQGLVVGARRLDEKDQPEDRFASTGAGLVNVRGQWVEFSRKRSSKGKAVSPPGKKTRLFDVPQFDGWQVSTLTEFIQGSAAAYQPLDGPQPLEALAPESAYVWYRLNLEMPNQETIFAPGSDDRLLLFHNGRYLMTWGRGPDARPQPVKARFAGTLVFLAQNMGRYSDGWRMGELKGLYDHLYAVQPLKLPKPKRGTQRRLDLGALGQFWNGMRLHDPEEHASLTWDLRLRPHASLILELRDDPCSWGIACNGRLVGMYHPIQSDGYLRITLHPGSSPIQNGGNELRLIALTPGDRLTIPLPVLRAHVTRSNLTAHSQWAYARWSPPPTSAYASLPRRWTDQAPRWYRTTFSLDRVPENLSLKLSGLSHGQLYLNGHNLGQYWEGGLSDKTKTPARCRLLPETWLHLGRPNELCVFDELGLLPTSCRLLLAEPSH